MNIKSNKLIMNFSYSLLSNLISLLVSTLVVFIIPKVIGVKEYGYWQLYLFYVSYVGFLHFGWNDGIYLRYGGQEYEELDKRLFNSQFYMLLLFQIIIGVVIYIYSTLVTDDKERIFIFQMVSLCLIVTNVRFMFLYILQATNRIKEYAQITVIGRILYFLLIITFVLIGVKEYKLMIFADLLGRLISLIYAIYCCNDVVFQKVSKYQFSFKEAYLNISVGSKLMFANVASMLVIGVVRYGIERAWNVTTFGKVSLTLSATNLIMIFINAIGIMMFPILRRTDKNKLSSIYTVMRDFLMVILLGVLIIYYPLKSLLSIWLPQYTESLIYMALLFPMVVYEGNMALLINTYLKTLRKEKLMLRINILTVLVSLIFTLITTIVLVNLDLAILSIVILLAFRSILAEYYLTKELNIIVKKDIICEIVLTIVFITSGWFVNSWHIIIIYGLAYCLYIIAKKKDIIVSYNTIKQLLKA